MSVIPKIPRASGGFAPCASYKGSNLDQLGTLSGPKTPRLLTTPLITNPGSAPVHHISGQPYIYPDDTYERGNPGQSWACFVFLWSFNQRWRTGFTITLLDSSIRQVSFQVALHIAGSTKCSTKPFSKLLTSILSAVKTGLLRYCKH
jgi:hypothetical protein